MFGVTAPNYPKKGLLSTRPSCLGHPLVSRRRH